jgi:hypothetical protein
MASSGPWCQSAIQLMCRHHGLNLLQLHQLRLVALRNSTQERTSCFMVYPRLNIAIMFVSSYLLHKVSQNMCR